MMSCEKQGPPIPPPPLSPTVNITNLSMPLSAQRYQTNFSSNYSCWARDYDDDHLEGRDSEILSCHPLRVLEASIDKLYNWCSYVNLT